MLAVLDERDVGREDGALDTTGWVTWTAAALGARARGLWRPPARCRSVPRSQWSRLQGRLSGEQLESLVQVATPSTDQQWASDGPGWSASSLRAAARNPR